MNRAIVGVEGVVGSGDAFVGGSGLSDNGNQPRKFI